MGFALNWTWPKPGQTQTIKKGDEPKPVFHLILIFPFMAQNRNAVVVVVVVAVVVVAAVVRLSLFSFEWILILIAEIKTDTREDRHQTAFVLELARVVMC